MELLISEFINRIALKNLFYIIPIIIIWVMASWFLRNKTERLFLPKYIAISQKVINELIWFIFLTIFAIFLLNMEIKSLAPNDFWMNLLLVLTIFFSLIVAALALNVKGIREKRFFKHKVIRFILFLLAAASIIYLYSYIIHGTTAVLNEVFNLNQTSSRAVFVNMFIQESFLMPLIYIFVISGIMYLPIRFSMLWILIEYMRKEFPKPPLKTTVVLKNGKIINDVFMKNNVPGNYFHFYNTDEFPSQTIVISKEEIESFLFTDSYHRNEETIEIENP